MLLRMPRSARCVQRFDDSLDSAIHITYHISLCSSSMREPRDPLLKVVYLLHIYNMPTNIICVCVCVTKYHRHRVSTGSAQVEQKKQPTRAACTLPKRPAQQHKARSVSFNNDPSAGSPTETLLRLLLPLNDQV
jgi:hypothetical protein